MPKDIHSNSIGMHACTNGATATGGNRNRKIRDITNSSNLINLTLAL
jgi:hypothetical protein